MCSSNPLFRLAVAGKDSHVAAAPNMKKLTEKSEALAFGRRIAASLSHGMLLWRGSSGVTLHTSASGSRRHSAEHGTSPGKVQRAPFGVGGRADLA